MRPGMFVPILLDPLTLFISNALVYLALTLALGITSRLAPDILAIRLWMRAYGLMTLGLSLMVAMSQLLPSWPPQRLVISMLVISGQLLVLAGLRHFFGLRPLPLGLKVAYLFSLAGLVLAGVLWPTIPMAGLWSACVVTFLMLGNLQVIWRQRSHLRRLILWPTLASISGICLGLLLRIGLLLLSLFSETHEEGWYYLSNLTGLLVVMIGGIGMAMSFWLLITDRMVYALRQIAERDPLTGIFNRRGFQRTVDQLLARQPNTLTVMMLDIDHFKRVNDQFGHAAGDQVLVCMGDILRDALRASDIFARLGGEEFCVVMHDRSPHTAKDVGERIRRRFARRTAQLQTASACTLSVGVASGEARLHSLAELMARADLALYRCKASGRDQLQVYDPSHDRRMADDDEPFPWH